MTKPVLMNGKLVTLFQKELKTKYLIVGEDMVTVQLVGDEDEGINIGNDNG